MNDQIQNQTTTIVTGVEDAKCTCCQPGQPLVESSDKGVLECPVTGTKYTFDPAMGGVQPYVARQPVEGSQSHTTAAPSSRPNFFPDDEDEEALRRVNPQDPFA